MKKRASNLEQAIIELIDGYLEIEENANSSVGDDQDLLANSIVDSLEASMDSAIEESNITTTKFASLLAYLSEALEQIDPSAFEEDEFTAEEDTGMESLDEMQDYEDDDDYD